MIKPLIGLLLLSNTIRVLALNASLFDINISVDGQLTFAQRARKYVPVVEEYDVTTADGYVLRLYRIPGNITGPVLAMHGILDSADTYVVRGETSMSIHLAKNGYDVWIGNVRGSRYSEHTALSTSEKAFWDFSFHEMGYYDLPAIIDFILEKTGSKKVRAIGHSQGTTIFYVMGATRPEYNDKIKVFTSLAPICYLNNIEGLVSTVIKLSPILNIVLQALGIEHILTDGSTSRTIIEAICSQNTIGYEVCIKQIFFAVAGSDPEELEADFVPTLIGRYPSSTSRKNLYHTAQIGLRGIFSQYDYGFVENLAKYMSVDPPEYDLSKVTMPIVLFSAKNDKLSTLPDVELLKQKLPNVVEDLISERDLMNHIDHVWGLNMGTYLFPTINRILEEYQD